MARRAARWRTLAADGNRQGAAACACAEDQMLPMALRLDDEVRAVIEEIGDRAGRERSLRALQQLLQALPLPSAPW